MLRLLLAPEGQTQSYIAPAYASARRLLAFIAIVKDGVRNVEMTTLRVTADDPPPIVEPTPRIVLANCGSRCNTLTWTASGNQLVFAGMDGLIAVNPFIGEQRPVTQGAHDSCPACSPDGAWLAYQHDVETVGYTEGVPAVDCLPVNGAAAMARIVSGYIVAWHPTWSVHGSQIAFLARTKQDTQGYVVDAHTLTAEPSGTTVAPRPVGATGCAEPVRVTHMQTPQNVLLVLCPGAAGSQFISLSGADLDVRQTLGEASVGPHPTVYNPIWIPPAAARKPYPPMSQLVSHCYLPFRTCYTRGKSSEQD